jgi:D-alanyl-D-alanine carboxypeptidase
MKTTMSETGGLLFALAKLIWYSGADDNINPGSLYYLSYFQQKNETSYYLPYDSLQLNNSYDPWAEFIEYNWKGLSYDGKTMTSTGTGTSGKDDYTIKTIVDAVDNGDYVILELNASNIKYYDWSSNSEEVGLSVNHFVMCTGYDGESNSPTILIDDSLSSAKKLSEQYSLSDVIAVHIFKADATLQSKLSSYKGIVEIPWNLILVNKDNEVTKDYIEAVKTSKVNVDVYSGSTNNKYARNEVDSRVASDMESMANAFKSDTGDTLYCQSGMRSYDYQTFLYDNNAKANGVEHADKYSSKPGKSEHNIGLAMDFGAKLSNGSYVSTEINYEDTSAFKWLCKHAHEYGFILRYPEGSVAENSTGYGYEPWHWRYIGKEYAKKFIDYVGADINGDDVLAYSNSGYNGKTYEDFYKEIVVPAYTKSKNSTDDNSIDTSSGDSKNDNLYSDEAPRRLSYFMRHPIESLSNFIVGMFQSIYMNVAVDDAGSVSDASWLLSSVEKSKVIAWYIIIVTISSIVMIIVRYVKSISNNTSKIIYNTTLPDTLKIIGITFCPMFLIIGLVWSVNSISNTILNKYQDTLIVNELAYSITAKKLDEKKEDEENSKKDKSNKQSGENDTTSVVTDENNSNVTSTSDNSDVTSNSNNLVEENPAPSNEEIGESNHGLSAVGNNTYISGSSNSNNNAVMSTSNVRSDTYKNYNGGVLDVNQFTSALGTVAAEYCRVNPSYKSGGLHYTYNLDGKTVKLDACCTTIINLTWKLLNIDIYGNSTMYAHDTDIETKMKNLGFQKRKVETLTDDEWLNLSPGAIFVSDGSKKWSHVEIFMGWVNGPDDGSAYSYDSGKGCLGTPPAQNARKSYSTWTSGCTFVKPMLDKSGWSKNYVRGWFNYVYLPYGTYSEVIETDNSTESSSNSNNSSGVVSGDYSGDYKLWTDEELKKDIFKEELTEEYTPLYLTFTDGGNEVKKDIKTFYDEFQKEKDDTKTSQKSVSVGNSNSPSNSYDIISPNKEYSLEDLKNYKINETPNNYIQYSHDKFIPVNYTKYGSSVFYYFYDYIKYQYLSYSYIKNNDSFVKYATEPKDNNFDISELSNLTQDKYVREYVRNSLGNLVPEEESYEAYKVRMDYVESQLDCSFYGVSAMYDDYSYVYNNSTVSDLFGLSYMFNLTRDYKDGYYAIPTEEYRNAKTLDAWAFVEKANYLNQIPNYEDYNGYNFSSSVLASIIDGDNWTLYSSKLSSNPNIKTSYYFTPEALGYKDLNKEYRINNGGLIPYRAYVSKGNYEADSGKSSVNMTAFEKQLSNLNNNIYDRISNLLKCYAGELSDNQMIFIIALIATEEFNKTFSKDVQPQGIDPGNVDVDKIIRMSYSSSLAELYANPDTMYLVYNQKFGMLNVIFLLYAVLFMFVNNLARTAVIIMVFISAMVNCILYGVVNKEFRGKSIAAIIVQLSGVIINYFLNIGIICKNMELQIQFNGMLVSPVITLVTTLLLALNMVVMVALWFAYAKDIANFGSLSINKWIDEIKNSYKENLTKTNSTYMKAKSAVGRGFLTDNKIKNTKEVLTLKRITNLTKDRLDKINKEMEEEDEDEEK